jgi:hypothetical protein
MAPAGCKEKKASSTLAGSGIQKTKEVEIPPFSRLSLNGRMQVALKVGGHRSLEVKGDDNIIGHVRARLENGVMTIDTDTPVKGTMPLELRLGAATLESISVSGVTTVRIEGLAAKDFKANTTGVSKVIAEGTADSLTLTGKEVSSLDFTKVVSRSAKVELVKAATARVGYLENLDVRMQDATRVFYEGEPNITKDVKRPAFMVKTK